LSIDIDWGTKVIDMPDESAPPVRGSVTDNQPAHRFELSVNGETAFLVYERTADTLTLIHTEVPAELRGHHLGDALVEAALQSARSDCGSLRFARLQRHTCAGIQRRDRSVPALATFYQQYLRPIDRASHV
jgi:hypothetical protein